MFEVKFDFSDFERMAERFGGAADQVPYVISRLLNDAAFNARRVLVQSTWPKHVTQRNPNWPSAALRVEKSTKHVLAVEINDVIGRGHLQAHAVGGVRRGRRGVAIPLKGWVQYGQRGVRRDMWPTSIVANAPRRALRVTTQGIFVGEGGRLHLRYSFKPMATQPADVPFYETFAEVMSQDMRAGFGSMMAKAMSTRIA